MVTAFMPAETARRAASSMKRVSANHKTEEIMTVSALADYLRCSPNVIYALLRRREIPAFKLGGDWRILRSEIDKWIARIPPYQRYKLYQKR